MHSSSTPTFRIAIKTTLAAAICGAALAAGCSAPAGAAAGESPVTEGSTKGSKTKKSAPESLEGFESFHPQGDAKVYYTGYDGVNDYVAPLAFIADEPPSVTIGDPAVAEVKGKPLTITKEMVDDLPDILDGRLQLVMVRSLQAGETTVTATSGDTKQTATLKITQYTEADVALGDKRYNEGSPACTSCHAKLGVHNPTVLVDLSDETILGIAVDGKSIEKVSVETGQVETLKPNKGSHKWSVTEAERTGLMAYLRSRKLTFQRF